MDSQTYIDRAVRGTKNQDLLRGFKQIRKRRIKSKKLFSVVHPLRYCVCQKAIYEERQQNDCWCLLSSLKACPGWFIVNLTQVTVIWEEGLSVEKKKKGLHKISLQASLRCVFLISVCCEESSPMGRCHHWAGASGLSKKACRASQQAALQGLGISSCLWLTSWVMDYSSKIEISSLLPMLLLAMVSSHGHRNLVNQGKACGRSSFFLMRSSCSTRATCSNWRGLQSSNFPIYHLVSKWMDFWCNKAGTGEMIQKQVPRQDGPRSLPH